MSEFSESYHLFTADQSEAVKLIKASGLRGFALAPENGWVSFVVDEGEFTPDLRITKNNQLILLHYVNAEDHGWSFELFDGSRGVCRYRCDWDNDVWPDLSGWKLSEISRLLGGEIAQRVAQIVPQFSPKTIDELFEHQTAYEFAQSFALPHYEWFSYPGVEGCFEQGDKDYPGSVEVPAQKV